MTKIVVVLFVLTIVFPWVMRTMLAFMTSLLINLPQYGR